MTWEGADHVSGIYYVKEEGTVTVVVDNGGREGMELAGEILFGSREGEEFKILTVTPIATTMMGAGQRARIPLKVAFGAAGTYELRWKHGAETVAIAGVGEMGLECIFAPRTAREAGGVAGALGAAGASVVDESPWVTMLPRGVVRVPGHLTDYVRRTTVRRFVIDERFAFDAAKNVGLGFGASTGAGVKEIDGLLAEAAQVKAGLILRVTVPVGRGGTMAGAADSKSITAFRQYVADAIKRGKGSLAGLAIVPGVEGGAGQTMTVVGADVQRRNFVAYYLAGYEAAKHADRNVALLGAGSATLTAQWLLGQDAKLGAYVDAVALGDAAGEPVLARQLLDTGGAGAGAKKKALYVLPPMGGVGVMGAPAAAGLAAGAAVVAVPAPGGVEGDHGVTAHLLGGAVMLQRLRVTVPTADRTGPESTDVPFVAVFQGDGYAVAAVAGFGAGTDLDGAYPALARTRTEVEPVKPDELPRYPNLQVGDDTRAMRVVDGAGAPVDCRVGDNLFVPAAEGVVYVLAGGTAEELAGSLRVGTGNRLAVFEVGVAAGGEGLTVRLHNIATRELGGTVRVILPPGGAGGDGETATVLAEKVFVSLGPDKTVELPMAVTGEVLGKINVSGPVVVEVTTAESKAVVQRTAVGIGVTR